MALLSKQHHILVVHQIAWHITLGRVLKKMNDAEIVKKITKVFWNKFQFKVENLTEAQKNQSLFDPEIGFKAVDLFVLYMELEKELDIKFDEKDVINNRFDIYNNILLSTKGHLISG